MATPGGIKFAQQQIQIGLEAAKTQMANMGEQGKTALASLGMYDSLINAMDKELGHLAVGLRMADDGAIHVVSRTLPVEGGTLARIASQAKPTKDNPLAGLPQLPFFVAGGGSFTPASMKSWMEMSFNTSSNFLSISTIIPFMPTFITFSKFGVHISHCHIHAPEGSVPTFHGIQSGT